MSWYADLSTVTMIARGDHVRAVGWLSATEPFPTGDVPAEFLPRLREFCVLWGKGLDSLWWGIILGPHRCEMCGGFMAGGNIGVPFDEVLFVAPEMIAHYVETHRYAPPANFIEAVRLAPLPGTPGYHEAVARFREAQQRQNVESQLD